MPNKTWTLDVDLIPQDDGEHNLGNSNRRWAVNGYIVNAAAAKDINTSIDDEEPGTDLPTSAAVVDYVADKTTAITNQAIDDLIDSIYGS